MGTLTATLHDALATNVMLPLRNLTRNTRPSLRPITRAFDDGLCFRRLAAEWTADEKRAWMLQRLRYCVRRAYDETEYYRGLLDRIGFDATAPFGFDDFARIPPLDREDVLHAGAALISARVPPGRTRKDATGGSTGRPTEIVLGPEEIGWRASAGEYYHGRLGVPDGTRTALLWGHHLDAAARDSVHARWDSFARNLRWFDCFRLSPDLLDSFHFALQRWQPVCVIAYASALAALAERVLEHNYHPRYPRRCFITGAEKLMPQQRRVIEEAFCRPVHERYGSRDGGHIGFQLRPALTLDYEIDWANILVEPETADPLSPILVTKLHADAMPMLRYRIGDVARFAAASRPGHPVLTLHEVVGRTTHRVRLPDGRWLDGLSVPHLLKDYPVREFKLTQRGDYSIELDLIPRPGFSAASEHAIETILKHNLGGLPLVIRRVSEIPRGPAGKWRPVVSEVQSGGEADSGAEP